MRGMVLLGMIAIRGLTYDGLPPQRFQHDALVKVAFVSNLGDYCGKAPINKHWGGCEIDHVMYVVNPCQMSGDYAFRLCHELGHAEGWSRYHEF